MKGGLQFPIWVLHGIAGKKIFIVRQLFCLSPAPEIWAGWFLSFVCTIWTINLGNSKQELQVHWLAGWLKIPFYICRRKAAALCCGFST